MAGILNMYDPDLRYVIGGDADHDQLYARYLGLRIPTYISKFWSLETRLGDCETLSSAKRINLYMAIIRCTIGQLYCNNNLQFPCGAAAGAEAFDCSLP